MKLSEFQIGVKFKCGGKTWLCTDIGTRVVSAILLDENNDLSWFNGPPYAVREFVFDEYDQKACTRS